MIIIIMIELFISIKKLIIKFLNKTNYRITSLEPDRFHPEATGN